VFGVALSSWAVHIPTVQEATGISTSMVGTVLLILGVGALAGMQFGGGLVGRFGSGPVAAAGGAAMSAALVLPLVATTSTALAAALFVFGLTMGITDVSMNARAVVVEREYRRPIMASFHGVFSIGTVIGSLLGAATIAARTDPATTAFGIAAVCLFTVCCAVPGLLRVGGGHDDLAESTPTAPSDGVCPSRRRVLTLGALAFLLFLSEGSAMDWSSLHAQHHLGVSESAGTLAFAAFVTAMTIGRFTVDRVVARVGPDRVLRFGSAIAVAGIATVMISPTLALTLVGWAMFGLGLAGGIPQVLTAAGNLPGASGTDFSRVVGIGYVAVLAGPGFVGLLTEFVPLNTTLLLPLSAVAVCAVAAVSVRPAGRRSPTVTEQACRA